MKLLCVCLVTVFICVQTPAWALRSSSYTSTLKSNEKLNQESSVEWNEDLKEESSFKENEELSEEESSFEDNKALKDQKSSFQDNQELKKGSAVNTRSYDTPIIVSDD